MIFSRSHRQPVKESGFTLVELMVVIGISVILFGLISINLGQTQTTGSVATVVDTLLSDIKHQQLQAMVGDVGGDSSQQPQGLYVQTSNYTLFAGASYSAGDSNNFVVNTPSAVTLSNNFSGNTLLFSKATGQVQSFVAGSNTITVSVRGESKIITIGRYGNLSVN